MLYGFSNLGDRSKVKASSYSRQLEFEWHESDEVTIVQHQIWVSITAICHVHQQLTFRGSGHEMIRNLEGRNPAVKCQDAIRLSKRDSREEVPYWDKYVLSL